MATRAQQVKMVAEMKASSPFAASVHRRLQAGSRVEKATLNAIEDVYTKIHLPRLAKKSRKLG